MKVERNVRLADDEKRGPRPAGSSISHTQLTQPCDKRLDFRRRRIPVASPLGIALVYGRALHAGVEHYARGAAKTPAQAIKAALRVLDSEVAKAEKGPGVRWDDWHALNQDGTPSAVAGNFGALPSAAFCRFWLERQLALWLLLYGRVQIEYSEHRLFTPLTSQPNWTQPWSIEVWLDLVTEVDGGWQILDLKSAAKPWEDSDRQKGGRQAHLYMGVAAREWGPPQRPFEFHVLPRTKAALPPLEIARAWALGELPADEARESLLTGGSIKVKTVTEGKGKGATKREVPVTDGGGHPVREWTLGDALQVVPVEFDPKAVNDYVRGVIRPKVSQIEAGIFPANPTGWHCSARFCDFYAICLFGTGDQL